jgi:hypothetical protein
LDKICRRTLQKEKWLALFGERVPTDAISFDDFLTAIAKQPISAMDSHWRPQYFQTFQENLSYDFIGRFETFGDDFARLSSLLRSKRPLVLRREANHATHAAYHLNDFYSPSSERLVREIYDVDFKHFGYSPTLAEAASEPCMKSNGKKPYAEARTALRNCTEPSL